MKKPFRQILKAYFNFSKKDRNAVVALSLIIILFLIGNLIVQKIELKPTSDFSAVIQALEDWENQTKSENENKTLFRFNPNTISAAAMDSLDFPLFVKRNILSYRSAGGYFSEPDDVKRIYGMNDSLFTLIEDYLQFPNINQNRPSIQPKPELEIERLQVAFDPNLANENDLKLAGFNSFQASNVVKYRKNGGVFLKPEDLLRIYGIDSAFYFSIADFIKMTDLPEKKDVVIVEAVSVPVQVELNSADTFDLLLLSGVGPVFASRIIKYRNLLGGFYGKHQLLEVYGFPEETYHTLREKILIDSLKVEKIRINFANYSDLIRHPYFDKEIVKAILNYREKRGPISSLQQLLSESLIDTTTYTLIEPYITCR